MARSPGQLGLLVLAIGLPGTACNQGRPNAECGTQTCTVGGQIVSIDEAAQSTQVANTPYSKSASNSYVIFGTGSCKYACKYPPCGPGTAPDITASHFRCVNVCGPGAHMHATESEIDCAPDEKPTAVGAAATSATNSEEANDDSKNVQTADGFRRWNLDLGTDINPGFWGTKSGGSTTGGVELAARPGFYKPIWLGGQAYGRYVYGERFGALVGVEAAYASRRVGLEPFVDLAAWFTGPGYVGVRFGAKLRWLLAPTPGIGIWAGGAAENYPGQATYAPWNGEIIAGLSLELGDER